jgi:hypothetical protein
MSYTFDSAIWLHSGGSWHFVTLPHDQSDEIDERTMDTTRGFGSVRVQVTIGSSTWATSLFPDSKEQAYVLPIKKPVRTKEGIAVGDIVTVHIELVDVADV